jgi:hypothetical protein
MAEFSELASSIRNLLRGVGIPPGNIRMINEFGSDDMESFNDLCINCDVCFVSSTVECVRIKKMGFPGRVVLFSGSLAYMDDVGNLGYHSDYIIQMPYMKKDLDSLRQWLISPIKETKDRPNKLKSFMSIKGFTLKSRSMRGTLYM